MTLDPPPPDEFRGRRIRHPASPDLADYQMQVSTDISLPKEVVVISHSPIFYWWPVWFVGFLMAAWTYLDGHLMAIVPAGTVAEGARTVDGQDGPRDVLVLP